jgi:hypothetical protein
MMTNTNPPQLPRNWRRLPDDYLQRLADELNQLGEWELAEDVEGELELREDERMLGHPDSPSLGDLGIHLGSYAS